MNNNILINKIKILRKKTGLGIIDCKNALIKANGDINYAIILLKDKIKEIFDIKNNNLTNYGIVIAGTNKSSTIGAILSLNCETDFVSKNQEFIKLAYHILNIYINISESNKDFLLKYKNRNDELSIQDKILELISKTKENIQLSFLKKIKSPFVSYYNHTGNKLASIVSFSKYYSNIENIGKNIAMQIAAMKPIYIDDNEYKLKNINNIQNNLSKILIHQNFIKDNTLSIKKYLNNFNSELIIKKFYYYNF